MSILSSRPVVESSSDQKPSLRRAIGRIFSRRHIQDLPEPSPRWRGLETLEPRLLLSASLYGTDDPDHGRPTSSIELFNLSPALFVENQGQWEDESVRYLHQGDGANIAMTDTGPVFQVFRTVETESEVDAGAPEGFPGDRLADREPPVREMRQFSAGFVNAQTVTPIGLEQSDAVFNYYIGDVENHRSGVPGYEIVAYEGLYDGIDLHMWGQRSNIKYEFLVAPGGDWTQIQVRYEGIEGLEINDAGELVVNLGEGWDPLVDAAPYVYQDINGQRVDVASRYVLVDEWTYSFELGGYDPDHTLVVDPDLAWSSYLGGSGSDIGYGTAVDGSGNAWVTGYTGSTNFAEANNTNFGGTSAFVSKVSGSGTLLWSTYLGGSGSDGGRGIAVDGSGNALVTGHTRSTNFAGAINTNPGGGQSAFVSKVTGSGTLLWSTYLGGSGWDEGRGIALDGSDNAFVTGWTDSTNFAGANNMNPGGRSAFVSKVSGSGTLLWSTYLGGSGTDIGYDIAVDGSGNALVTGLTTSTNFAAANNTNPGGSRSAFVAKIGGAGAPIEEWAPESIAGRVFTVQVEAGTWPFAPSGSYIFRPEADGTYTIETISEVPASSGTYIYTRTGPNTGEIEFNDSLIGPGVTQELVLTGPNGGSYTITHSASGGWQTGTFSVSAVEITQLSNGVPVHGLNGLQGSEQHFVLNVPEGATNLVFSISGGTGDADLYVRHGAPPTLTEWDYRPYLAGNNETVTPSPIDAGNWYVMLHGWSNYDGVTLIGSFLDPEGQPTLVSPSNLTASDDHSTRVTVSWSSVTHATHYEVWRSETNDLGTAVLIAELDGLVYHDEGALLGTKYYYWVRATQGANVSPFSEAVKGYCSATIFELLDFSDPMAVQFRDIVVNVAGKSWEWLSANLTERFSDISAGINLGFGFGFSVDLDVGDVVQWELSSLDVGMTISYNIFDRTTTIARGISFHINPISALELGGEEYITIHPDGMVTVGIRALADVGLSTPIKTGTNFFLSASAQLSTGFGTEYSVNSSTRMRTIDFLQMTGQSNLIFATMASFGMLGKNYTELALSALGKFSRAGSIVVGALGGDTRDPASLLTRNIMHHDGVLDLSAERSVSGGFHLTIKAGVGKTVIAVGASANAYLRVFAEANLSETIHSESLYLAQLRGLVTDDVGNTPATAMELQPNQDYQFELYPTDVDYFRFNSIAGQAHEFVIYPDQAAVFDVVFYDRFLNEHLRVQVYPDVVRIPFRPDESGYYYVAMTGVSGSTSLGQYRFTWHPTTTQANFDDGLLGYSTDGAVSLSRYTSERLVSVLKETSPAALKKAILLPEIDPTLTFLYRMTAPGDGDQLHVRINGVSVWSKSIDRVDNAFIEIGPLDLGAFAGQAVDVEFFLHSVGQPNAAFEIEGFDIGGSRALPASPSILEASQGRLVNRVHVRWSGDDLAESYQVFRGISDNIASASLLADGIRGGFFVDDSVATNVTYYYWIRGVNSAGTGAMSGSAQGFASNQSAGILGKYLFHGNSHFDRYVTAPGPHKDNAVFPEKEASLNLASLGPHNTIGVSSGINGIMIDGVRLGDTIGPDDFQFHVASIDSPTIWVKAPDPLSVAVRHGNGEAGSTRIEITWEDDLIVDSVLSVRMLAGANTRLHSDEVFYFAHRSGDVTGDGGSSDRDLAAIRHSLGTNSDYPRNEDLDGDGRVSLYDAYLLFQHYQPSTVLRGDINQDGVVDDTDLLMMQRALRSPDNADPRADLDGDSHFSLYDAYLLFQNYQPSAYPIGDANRDGVVDDVDLSILQSSLGTEPTATPHADFDADGKVSLYDAYLLFRNYQPGGTGATSTSILGFDEPDEFESTAVATEPGTMLTAASDPVTAESTWGGSYGGVEVESPLLAGQTTSAGLLLGLWDAELDDEDEEE